MLAHRLTPILNVSSLADSFLWFEKLGWRKGWDWGDPPTFGGVCSGVCEIFLCQGAQGGRGNGGVKMTYVVWSRALISPGRRQTCRGAFERCTCGIQMAMSCGSVRGLPM
jgi:hypothetical protein